MGTPSLGIVINNYNYAHKLEAALKSVNDQRIQCSMVIVDDCSTDGIDLQWLSVKYGAKVLRLPANRGLGIARNVGVSFLNTDYFLCLDADDQLVDGALRALMDRAIASPGDGVIYGNYFEITPEGKELYCPTRAWTQENLRRNNVSMYCNLIARWAWHRVGGYTDFRMAEDYEFQCLLWKHNIRVEHIDAVVFKHFQHTGSKWEADRQKYGVDWLYAQLRERVPEVWL